MRKAFLAGCLLLAFALIAGAQTTLPDCNSATIQNAVDAVPNGGSGTILLPQCNGLNGTSVGTLNSRITIPAGKNIILMGKTKVNNPGIVMGDPTVNPGTTADDNTILEINEPANSANGIHASLAYNGYFRISGITFRKGTGGVSGDGFLLIDQTGNTTTQLPTGQIRVDNIHTIYNLGSRFVFFAGWAAFGLVDHCLLENAGPDIYIKNNSWGGLSNGLGLWADFPYFGTNKFIYLENNTIVRGGTPQSAGQGFTDGDSGMKCVARYNYIQNCYFVNHGWEGAPSGARAHECYNNTFDFSAINARMFGMRSGTMLIHDNIQVGKPPATSGNAGSTVDYRSDSLRPRSPWNGAADGTSIWDKNVTDVGPPGQELDRTQHTFVEGHSPHEFFSGNATPPTVITSNVMTDTNTTFPVSDGTPGSGLKGYSISNYASRYRASVPPGPCPAPYTNCMTGTDGTDEGRHGGYIIASGLHTITFVSSNGSDDMPQLTFAAGDPYKIHRLLRQIGGVGAGKVDKIDGTGTGNPGQTGDHYRLQSTQQAGYPHIAYEPFFGWRNTYHTSGSDTALSITRASSGGDGYPGQAVGTSTGTTMPTCSGFDQSHCSIVNVTGVSAPTVPTVVKNFYTAAVNGVDYTGDFTYPHPCTADFPTCTGTAQATITDSLVQFTSGTADSTQKIQTANFSPAANSFIITTPWTPSTPAGITVNSSTGVVTYSGSSNAANDYTIPLTVGNGTQTATGTLTVRFAPPTVNSITPTFTIGGAVSCTGTKTNCATIDTSNFAGTPTLTVSNWTPSIPSNVSFSSSSGVGTIQGTGAGNAAGTYVATILASVASPAQSATGTITLTLQAGNAPKISGASSANYQVGVANSTVTFTASNFSANPTWTKTGTLPSGVTFAGGTGSTTTITGTPANGTDGSSPYDIIVTATNSATTPAEVATFAFRLNVSPGIVAPTPSPAQLLIKP